MRVSAFSAVIASINNTGARVEIRSARPTTYAVLTDFQTWVCRSRCCSAGWSCSRCWSFLRRHSGAVSHYRKLRIRRIFGPRVKLERDPPRDGVIDDWLPDNRDR